MIKNKKRVILVITFLVLFAIYIAINLRGEYLKTLQIGQEYLGVFEQNVKFRFGVILINFVVLYIATYLTTNNYVTSSVVSTALSATSAAIEADIPTAATDLSDYNTLALKSELEGLAS